MSIRIYPNVTRYKRGLKLKQLQELNNSQNQELYIS